MLIKRKLHWTAKVSVILSFWFLFWLLWFVIFFSIAKTMFFYESRQSYITHPLTGEVTSIKEERAKGKRSSFFGGSGRITTGWIYKFTYNYNGKDYTGESNSKPPKLYFEGETVPVLIDPKYPKVSQLENTTNVVISPIGSAILTSATGVIFFFLAYSAVRRIQTLKNGKIRIAIVDKLDESLYFMHGKSRISKKPVWFKFKYRNKDRVSVIHHKDNAYRFYPLPSIAAKLDEPGVIWRSSIIMTLLKLGAFVFILLIFILNWM